MRFSIFSAKPKSDVAIVAETFHFFTKNSTSALTFIYLIHSWTQC